MSKTNIFHIFINTPPQPPPPSPPPPPQSSIVQSDQSDYQSPINLLFQSTPMISPSTQASPPSFSSSAQRSSPSNVSPKQFLQKTQSPSVSTKPSSRFGRLYKPNPKYANLHHIIESENNSIIEPLTLSEALNSPQSNMWQDAISSEYNSLMRNGTWELVPLPPNRKAINCKWIFKLKYKADGSIDRFKARLVAKGYSQVQGMDYNDTFSPVVKITTIRVLLALAAMYDWEVHQLDVTTAFLYGDLSKDIYMKQPEGYVIPGYENKVCKLKKSLYGFKQASKLWYYKFQNYLFSLGFLGIIADSNVYIKQDNTSFIILALYVDDVILITNTIQLLKQIDIQFRQAFAMTNHSPIHYILGIHIERNRMNRTIKIHQQKYILNILKHFQMINCNPIGKPFEVNVKLTKDQRPQTPSEINTMSNVPYAQAVGALGYASVTTRPALTYAVGEVSQHSINPRQAHWNAVKRIFRYLKGTIDHGIVYGFNSNSPNDPKTLVGYTYADWAGDVDGRKSTSGYAFILANGVASWSSKRQQTVALSSIEAEYKAATEACKEGIWLRQLLQDIGFVQNLPTMIHCDNQSAIALTKNPQFHARTKHIEIQFHFIREVVEDGQIRLEYVHTSQNIADIFTK